MPRIQLPPRSASLVLLVSSMAMLLAEPSRGADDIVTLGAGSYTLAPPQGIKPPPESINKTESIRGPIPTNRWWSSLAWKPFSDPQYAHPLAVKTTPAGLQIYYPGPSIIANPIGVLGEMASPADDLILGHSAEPEFADARLHDYSDWFVTAQFAHDSHKLLVTYGHGSPYVYALYEGGEPRVGFPQPPKVWFGDEKSPALGVSINGRHYGLFGPNGATWSGLDSKSFACQTHGKPYFTIALLPDDTPETFQLFRRHAHAHVTGTKVDWKFDPRSSTVSEHFSYVTKPYEGKETETLFALYPHQWRHSDIKLLGKQYDSVRGVMKLARGSSFDARYTFPGVLFVLPGVDADEKQPLGRYLADDMTKLADVPPDTYWAGKQLGKLATLIPLAEQAGDAQAKDKLLADLRNRLETWLDARPREKNTSPSRGGQFYYDRRWGTLIGAPASYGSDDQLNDHHFHYGYFIRAAAEIARHDPAWAADKQWGGMLRLVIRDIASPDRNDPMFPFLRAFDVYAGHSWASGHARFASGNNQESTSEAMNAWTGLILLGETLGDRELRDLGIFLFTTELAAIDEYWFDVSGENRPAAFTPSVVTMVWGGKSVNETWFSNKPSIVHGINWIPFHGGSLYLGRYPDYVRRNYDALVKESGGEKWDEWPDAAWMYRALVDPPAALRLFEAQQKEAKIEVGNSRANAYHWIRSLAALGQVERTITADYPLYAVFRNGNTINHVAYNVGTKGRTVRFSDGAKVDVAGHAFGVERSEAK